MKAHLYNFDPHNPHFYTVKLGFTGVYIFFFGILLKNIDYGCLQELPQLSGSNKYHKLYFEQRYDKYQNLFWKRSVFGAEIFNIFE